MKFDEASRHPRIAGFQKAKRIQLYSAVVEPRRVDGGAQEQQLETRCLPANLTDRELKGALRDQGGVRVLHLGDAPLLWGGWEDTKVPPPRRRSSATTWEWMKTAVWRS